MGAQVVLTMPRNINDNGKIINDKGNNIKDNCKNTKENSKNINDNGKNINENGKNTKENNKIIKDNCTNVQDHGRDNEREFVIISFSEDQHFLDLKRAELSMVKSSWVVACHDRCSFADEGESPKSVALQPKYMMYMNSEMAELFEGKFDQFGDGYMEDCTVDELTEMLTSSDDVTWAHEIAKVGARLSKKEIRDMEATLAACNFKEDDRVLIWLPEDRDSDVAMSESDGGGHQRRRDSVDAGRSESESESHNGRKGEHDIQKRQSTAAVRRRMSESASKRGGSDGMATARRKRKERGESGDVGGVWTEGVVVERNDIKEEYLVYYYDSAGKVCEKSVPFWLVQSLDEKDRPQPLAWSMFSECKMQEVDVHSDDWLHVSRLKLATACLIAGGGELVTMENEHEKTHILVEGGFDSDSDIHIKRRLLDRNVSWDDTVRIVDASWVIQRYKAGKMRLDSDADGVHEHEYFLSMDED
jgi:hypothetical protein